jgi:hypothetical protein
MTKYWAKASHPARIFDGLGAVSKEGWQAVLIVSYYGHGVATCQTTSILPPFFSFRPWSARSIIVAQRSTNMANEFHWGPANPHPLPKMRTEFVWDPAKKLENMC